MNRIGFRSTIVISTFLLGLVVLSFSSLSAQVKPPDRIDTQTAGQLPDLSVLDVGLHTVVNHSELFLVDVTLINRGNAKSESANVNAPFKVWLRIWKPTDAKSAEGPTSGKNSFLWGGVVTVNELIRPGPQTKKVRFTISTEPPGGWQATCMWGGVCVHIEKDPLRWRAMVVVDSANVIKESNETNNTYIY